MAQGGPTLVEVDEVVSEPLRQTQPVQGRFVARQSGPIASRTRGAVMIMHVFVGDAVTAGEPLATLDTARLQAETARKRAEVQYRAAQVDGAIARHEQSEQELDRMEKLRRSAAFSRARFDDQTSEVISAKSHIAEAKAQLETAEAELALAEIDLKNSVVLAPYLRDGDPVVDLVDHQSLEIEADIPASRVASLESGMTVTALIEGREPLSATVRAIVPQENTLSRTRAVRFSPTFDPVMVGAAAEAVVTVRVPVGVPRDVVTVHKDAIVQQGGTVVYAVEDGKAVRKRVRLGESAGSRFVVEDGLAPGAMVVIRGNERLRPGQPVTYPGMKPLPGSESGQTPPTATGKPDGAKKDADS
jgi:RND family efflux transporter MFP subunit